MLGQRVTSALYSEASKILALRNMEYLILWTPNLIIHQPKRKPQVQVPTEKVEQGLGLVFSIQQKVVGLLPSTTLCPSPEYRVAKEITCTPPSITQHYLPVFNAFDEVLVVTQFNFFLDHSRTKNYWDT